MIKETFDNDKTFSFDLFSPGTIFKEIVSLDTNKSTYSNDVPTKVYKVNANLFSMLCIHAFNKSVISCIFSSILKSSDITPVHKKSQSLKNLTIDQQVYYLTFQNFLKDACIDKFQNILKLYFRNFNVVLRKFAAPKIVLVTVVNCKKALDQGKE